MLTPDLLRRLPKAELHVHLDGSLRPETMLELAREAGVTLPTTDPAALRRHMRVDDARHLEDYLARFELTIAVLQSREAITRVAREMVEDAARDGLRYIEIRYCPWLSTRRGLTLDEVMEAWVAGLAAGERASGVLARAIVCSLRHYAPAVSDEIARVAVRFRERGVVAFDLAGGEAGRPPGVHGTAFDLALAGGLGITIHAGEAAGPASIREALVRCHAMRLGHGTRLVEDPELERFVRDRQVPIEINLTSNLQTRAVASADRHPVKRYLELGIPVTLCTDSWLMSGVQLSDEYATACAALGFTRADVDRLVLNGFRAAFLPWPERARLVREVEAALGTLA